MDKKISGLEKELDLEDLDGLAINSLSVDLIDPNPWQPRKHFKDQDLSELAQSLAEDGVLQPLIVSRHPQYPERYVVIAGERRLRAAKLAGLDVVPTILREFATDDQLRIALIENIQRSDLNVIEEARAYKCLIEQFNYSHEECAKKVGKAVSTILNAIRLLSLPEEVQTDVIAGRLTAGHAKALASLASKSKIIEARDWMLKKKMSVRAAEEFCRRMKNGASVRKSIPDPDLQYIAETLRSTLRTKIEIKGTVDNGKIEVSFFSSAEFERILALIGYEV
jgi:ParB family chromosome partitioning protein